MFVRRRVLGCVTVFVLGFSVFSAAGAPPGHAQASGECVLQGSAVAVPGLGVVPAPDQYSISGSFGPCVGLPAGSFGGSMTCPLDSLAGCTPVGTVDITSSPVGTCTGVMDHQAFHYIFVCTGGGPGVMIASFVMEPLSVGIPVTGFSFVGTMTYGSA